MLAQPRTTSEQVRGGWLYDDRAYFHTKYCTNPVSVTPDIVGVDKEVWRGEKTPHFLKRKRRGDLIPYTNWVKTTQVGNWSSSYIIQWKSGFVCGSTTARPQSYTVGGDAFSFPKIDEAELDSWIESVDVNVDALVAGAASDCYSKGADMLTILVEFRKLGPDLVRLAKRVRKHKPDHHGTGTAEANFGWGNTIRDLVDIIQTFNRLGETPYKMVTGRAGTSLSASEPYSSTYANAYYSTSWIGNTTYNASFRGSCCAKYTPPAARTNILTTAWEVIPWSWLVDYVIGVGQYLEQQSLLAVSQGLTTARGLMVSATRQAALDTTWLGGYTGTIYGAGVHTITKTMRVRVDPPKYPEIKVRAADLDLVRLLTDIMAK